MKIRNSLFHLILVGFFMTCSCINPASAQDQYVGKIKPAQAKRFLEEGNIRFVSGKPLHPRQDTDSRKEVAKGQHPFAVILGCADSRTSPEILFDQGLGDLFVTRVAGNVIDDHTIGSIEYAVEHLHASLIVVFGHERCGAIAAARDSTSDQSNHIKSLTASIQPAVKATRGQDIEATCMANIRNIVVALKSDEMLLKQLVNKGEISVVGAYYDLETGIVTFLDEKQF